jgi:hypothetical protein
MDRRWHPNILDVQSLRVADCDADHYLVLPEVEETLAVSKWAAEKIDMERLYLKKLNEGEVKEQYQVTTNNRFVALENLENNGDINRAWDTIKEKIKIYSKESLSYCASDEECSKLVDRRKQTKLQWLQDASEMNEDNLSNVRWEARRHIRNNKREYLKDKINKLISNGKNNIRK